MRVSEKIAHLEAENARLKARVAYLEAKFQTRNVDIGDDQDEAVPTWARGLTKQETAFVAILRKAYPRPVSGWNLVEGLPVEDHAANRTPKQAAVLAFRVREKIGKEMIETIVGYGYGLTQAGADLYDAPNKRKTPLRSEHGYSIPDTFLTGTGGSPAVEPLRAHRRVSGASRISA